MDEIQFVCCYLSCCAGRRGRGGCAGLLQAVRLN